MNPAMNPAINSRLEEVMRRIGSRPALIRMASVSDYFGDAAPYRIEEGIGMIDIRGPLSNARWSWGGTTYGDIQDQMKIATADPNVKGILLNVNSPGGETDNAFETAAAIAQAAAKKPMYACAATMAYSAAYLLASQAEKIYCTPTSGGVGSIGVYCAHMDYSDFLKQAGIKVTLISAGEGKTTGNPYEPLSAADEEEIQGEIDRLYGEFVAAVASGRQLDSAAVVKLGARMYDGAPKAIASRLADAPGDLATAWVDLCAITQRSDWSALMRTFQKSSAASAANSTTERQHMETPNAAEAARSAEAEKQLAAALETAKQDGYGAAAEVVDLCSISGRLDLAAGFIGAKKAPADVRKELMAAKATGQPELNTTYLPGGKQSEPQGKAKPWGEVFSALGVKK